MPPNFMMSFDIPSFPVATFDLAAWAKANVSGCVSSLCDNRLKIVSSAALTSDQITAVKTYIASLTHNGEATKLALPHNLIGDPYQAWLSVVQVAAANAVTPTAAQKLLMMNATLTAAQMDGLPTS